MAELTREPARATAPAEPSRRSAAPRDRVPRPLQQPPAWTKLLAVTTREGTTYSPGISGHPREQEARAHEVVHRSQFALAGLAPLGTPAELEAEARLGARAVLHGRGFSAHLAAGPEMTLAFDHASAGAHLERFIAWLAKNTTNYDADAIDWKSVIPSLLASNRVYYVDSSETAVQYSQRLRYRLLVEIFDQELAAGVTEPQPPAAGLTVPTTRELEDLLFRSYLPTLGAADFAAKDVQDVGDAFLAEYLDQLAKLAIVPSTFRIEDYRPAPRDPQLESERERVVDLLVRTEMKDLAFKFLLDDFARAVGGPQAKVSGLPLLLGGGEQRSLTPEEWLATLDLAAYKDRLVAAMTTEAVKRLRKDAPHQRLLRTAADEQSRFQTLQAIHNVIAGFDRRLHGVVVDVRTLALSELDEFGNDVISYPYLAVTQFTAVSATAAAFYRRLRTDGDNDEAMLNAASELAAAIGQTQSLGQLLAEMARLGTLIDAYRKQLEASQRAIEQRLRQEIEVTYDEIAAGIAEMGAYADRYLKETFIPLLHKIALERITANVAVLQDRKDNWATYSASTAKRLAELADVLDDFAAGLRNGSYDKIELRGETVTVKNVKQLEDAAKICHAEAKAMREPASSSERYAKLVEALDGFADVKKRIKEGKIPPNHYSKEVFNAARKQLNLDRFAEWTTYGDIIFGRHVAAENPFLARLVIGWKFVKDFDDALSRIVLLAALGLMTVASLLGPPLVGAVLVGIGVSATTAAFATNAVAVVLWAIDAGVNLYLGWTEKEQAKAFLQLVRLDIDHSVTGVSEEDAERALTMAWFGLVLAVVLVAGGIGLAALARFAKGTSRGLQLSVRYFKLAREDPQLFASLRRIVTDPVRLDRMLAFAEDAKQLEALLHRMGRTFDLPMVERFLAATGDAARAAKVLDAASDVKAADAALTTLITRVPENTGRAALLELAGHDAVRLVRILDRTTDVAAARRLLGLVPDARRLAAILELPAAAGLTDDAIRTLGRLEPEALNLLKTASATDVADLVKLVDQDPAAMNVLFKRSGDQVLRHVRWAPYETVEALDKALRRSAARLGPQPGYQAIPVPALQKRTELVPGAPGWGGVLQKNKSRFTTQVTSPSGKPLTLTTRWDPSSGELSLDTAFTHPEIEPVPQQPFLVGRSGQQGAPAPVYFTLQQMRAAKIPYGATDRSGGVQTVRLHEIQNMDTVTHLHWLQRRYPQAPLRDLVPHTDIYRYGETIANQAGYRVVDVTVDTSLMETKTLRELTEHYAQPGTATRLRGMTPEAVRLEHQNVLTRFGLDPNTHVDIDFDIVLSVKPW